MTQTALPPLENPGYAKPIFIFVALLMSGITVAALPGLGTATVVVLVLLLLVHLLLHWHSGRWANPVAAWLLYAFIQASIVSGMTYLSGNPSLWGVAFTWLIAESVGFQARGWPLLITMIIYTGLGIVSLVAAFGQTLAMEWIQSILPTAVFIAIIVYLYRKQVESTEKAQQLVIELEAANRQISEYADRVEALTISHERQRIARELHDTLAQGLAGLILQLEAANAHLDHGRVDRAQTIIQATMSKTRTTLADARAVIDDLRAQETTHLDQQIENLCMQFETDSGIPCQAHIDLGIWQTQLTIDQQEQLERIVAEGLTNIQRHAQATAVTVNCVIEANELTLKIQDDGRGFDPNLVSRQGHYGLRGLRERARLLNAPLKIDSAPGKGTIIQLNMPLAKDPIVNDT